MATEFRVLIAGKIHDAGLEILRARNDVIIDYVEDVSTESYTPFLKHADAILIRTQPLRSNEIAAAPKLKIVSRHGVGFDAVDVNALNARGIPLTIVGDVNSRAVAEHTLMLMLAAARRTIAHHHASVNGNWNERNRFDSIELDGKALLVLGFGRIGRRVAELGRIFGMNVSAFDPYVASDQMGVLGVRFESELDAAIERADFICVHLPGGNKPAIGQNELELMKPTAIIINAARGGIIDEIELDLALRERRIRAAALDVLVDEPPSQNHPLLSNPYVTISPHNAGLTQECAMRMSIKSAQNILDFKDGCLEKSLIVNSFL